MTTAVPKLQMTETTVKPLIMSPDMSDMEENIMPLTTVTSEGKIAYFVCSTYLLLNHTNKYMCFLWYLLSMYHQPT